MTYFATVPRITHPTVRRKAAATEGRASSSTSVWRCSCRRRILYYTNTNTNTNTILYYTILYYTMAGGAPAGAAEATAGRGRHALLRRLGRSRHGPKRVLVRGNHLSNAIRPTQAFFKRGE